MKQTSQKNLMARGAALCAVMVLMSASFASLYTPQTAYALTLEQQLAQKKAAIKAAEEAKAKKEALAALAAKKVVEVSGQIQNLESNINTTQSSIQQTQQQLELETQTAAALESSLRRIQDQQDALVRQLYISSASQPDSMVFFSNESVSSREQKQSQFTALKKSVALIYAQTQSQKIQVEEKKVRLAKETQRLQALKAQQSDQKIGLADFRETQADLKNDAIGAAQRLQDQIAKDTAAAAEIARKIQILASTRNWGGQIVSSNDSSWYYTQTGNFTRFRGTIYTVNDYGCLITSIAMVATYYGKTVSPTFIAERGTFTKGGYYVSGTPSGLGVTVSPSQAINWTRVNQEIANNRPVIISIFIPSVGAINSDGSSHFVVIKGNANGKYLMHDPLGDGRGYDLSQVRSMKLVSNN